MTKTTAEVKVGDKVLVEAEVIKAKPERDGYLDVKIYDHYYYAEDGSDLEDAEHLRLPIHQVHTDYATLQQRCRELTEMNEKHQDELDDSFNRRCQLHECLRELAMAIDGELHVVTGDAYKMLNPHAGQNVNSTKSWIVLATDTRSKHKTEEIKERIVSAKSKALALLGGEKGVGT